LIDSNDPDDRLFEEAMGTVRRIAPVKTIMAKKAKPAAGVIVSERQAQLLLPPKVATSFPRQAEEPGVLMADGISRERLRRFAAGRPPLEQSLDLHGMTRHEALGLLDECFRSAIDQQLRALCIIHGRGLHSGGKPVLKEAVYQWLRDGPFAHAVLAVIPRPGSGGGACLVLLRRI